MKFHVLHVIALCLCLEQICLATNEYTEKKINKIQKDVRDKVNAVGEQFVYDVTKILEQSPNNPLCLELLHDSLVKLLENIPTKQNNVKIDVNGLKEFHSMKEIFYRDPTRPHDSDTDYIAKLDYFKILESTLSKQLPPERYNGIINLVYIMLHPNATSEEIANTLNYVYGTDNTATKISYLDFHDIPEPGANDCPRLNKLYSDAFDKLKSMTDIKPKVVEDLTSIREKFPCNVYVYNLINVLVNFIAKLHVDGYKADACLTLKFGPRMKSDSNDKWQHDLKVSESILSKRLPDETYSGLLNSVKVVHVNMPSDEFEKALEYVYDHVPEVDCTVPERARW